MKAIFLLPALVSAVAAQEQAPTLAQRFKVESPAINQLLASFESKQALAKVEAMLPAAKPDFDKSSAQAGLASSATYSTLMACYSLAGKAALTSGDWNKALGYFHAAKDVAAENYANTAPLLAPVIENWTKAVETATKALEEGAARRTELQAKPSRTESEETELKNFQIFDDNTKRGPMVVQNIKSNLEGLKADSEGFTAVIEGVDKSIKAEKDQVDSPQFKGDKIKYVHAVMNPTNLAIQITKADKIGFVNRLLFLDPSNKKAQKQLDVLLGKAEPEPEKKAPSKSKKKKGN